MGSVLLEDIRRTYATAHGGHAAKLLACLRSPGCDAVIALRFGQWLLRQPLPVRLLLTPVYLVMEARIRTLWGVEISRHARIGAGLYIGHSEGIVISPMAVIGHRCNLTQGVTIGEPGQGGKSGAPVIVDRAYIAACAKLSGKIRVGNNCKIGDNAVIHKAVSENAVVALDSEHMIISFAGNRQFYARVGSAVSKRLAGKTKPGRG